MNLIRTFARLVKRSSWGGVETSPSPLQRHAHGYEDIAAPIEAVSAGTHGLMRLGLRWLAAGCLAMASFLPAHAGEPLHYLATGVNADGLVKDDELIAFHRSATDDDGNVFAVGIFQGVVRFQGMTLQPLNPTEPRRTGIFVTRQGAGGGWDYLTSVFSSFPQALNTTEFGLTLAKSIQVNDVEVDGTSVYIAATINEATTVRAGVVIKVAKDTGAVTWIRYITGTDVTMNALAVDSGGRVTVGGAFKGYAGNTATPARVLSPAQGAPLTTITAVGNFTDNVDAYLVQFTAAGAVGWTSRSGTSTTAGHETVAAISADGLDQLHVLMNFDGVSVGSGKSSPVDLRNSTIDSNSRYTTTELGCYPIVGDLDTCQGSKTAIAGKLSANGRWLDHLVLEPDAHLKAQFLALVAGMQFEIDGKDLCLFDGKIYVAGSYNLMNGNGSTHRRGGFILRLADDYTADPDMVYFRPGGAESPTFPVRMVPAGGRLLAVGYASTSVNLHATALSDTSLGDVDMELNHTVPNDYVVSFNNRLVPQWITSTAEPGTRPTPNVFTGRLLAFNSDRKQILWGGGFRTSSLRRLAIGEGDDILVLENDTLRDTPESWGWIVALNTDGEYQLQQRLNVDSRFGPVLVNNTLFSGSGNFIRGSRISISVSPTVSTNNGGTRHVNTGYSLNDEINSGSANNYTLELFEDTTLTFNWVTEHRLTIASTHADAGLPTASTPGEPTPPQGSHWIRDGSPVNPSINGIVPDPADFDLRYYVSRIAVTGTVGQTNSYPVPNPNPAPTQFAMTGPVTITYSWRKQTAVTIAHNATAGLSLPLTRQLDPAGAVVSSIPGSGRFWFDFGARLEVMARASDTAASKSLVGWQGASPADPAYFPVSTFSSSPLPGGASLTTHLTSLTVDGNAYWRRSIAALNRPISVLWDYGSSYLVIRAAVGTDIVYPANSPAVLPQAPTGRELLATAGVGTTDTFAWDERRKVAVAIRPGIFELTWKPVAASAPDVKALVYTGFDGDPWQDDAARRYTNTVKYRHIAQTPGVELDPSATDARYFDGLLFHLGGAGVNGSRFSADRTTKSVLLFRTNVLAARTVRDPNEEILDVRVVETRAWDAPTAWTGGGRLMLTAGGGVRVGSPLGTPLHTGIEHTGYVVKENANYNPLIYDRANAQGPIIPVNVPVASVPETSDQALIIVWYERRDGLEWPYQPMHYPDFFWPLATVGTNLTDGDLHRIVIASRLGSEGLSTNGVVQPSYDPDRFENVQVYNQPDRTKAGYNPNEEHARVYPSLLAALDGRSVPAVFALRNDLNISRANIVLDPITFRAADYTSDPYVLVQYFDKQAQTNRMRVYNVQRVDNVVDDPRLDRLPGSAGRNYRFIYNTVAGNRINPPYPLDLILGLFPCVNTVPGNPFVPESNIPNGTFYRDADAQRCWHIDHKGGGWVVSGDSAFEGYFYYPLQADFYYPFELDRTVQPDSVGDCIPWLPRFAVGTLAFKGVFDTNAVVRSEPLAIRYNTSWPTNVAVLKAGETLTYPGGENRLDNPDAPGLPGIIGFAAASIVFDSLNPGMQPFPAASPDERFSARVMAPLEERLLPLPRTNLPVAIRTPGVNVEVNGNEWVFTQLPPSLRKRVFYRPLAKLTTTAAPGVLGLRGYVNDRTLGAPDLTATPPPVYVVEPNVLTETERRTLADLAAGDAGWTAAVNQLYALARDPNGVGGITWNVGLMPGTNSGTAIPFTSLGVGLALVSNPALLVADTNKPPIYVTLAENDHPSLGDAPVSLHVIQVSRLQKYRGALKAILPPNVFDEKITLRHTADFGGNVDRVAYAWWFHEEDGTVKVGDVPGNVSAGSPPWSAVGDPNGTPGLNQIELNGNPTLLLADNLFYARYRHVDGPAATASNWSDWAGAANSSIRDLTGDGRPDFRPQLAMGWVKRVLDGINPYEARVREFSRSDSPATAASLLRTLGAPFSGPVALNADKNVVENVGLIELYETVLQRARDMSIQSTPPVTSPGLLSALMLASSRLSYFYSLLGNEAWDDSMDPTVGYGRAEIALDVGNLTSSRFCFENQQASLLDEELALLRGTDESLGRPVFNRLFWNFTKGEGEVAYALNYQIKDVTGDGILDESDGLRLFPQGHGDAWGHYLSAIRKHYDLINTPGFIWQRRSEYYNLLDVVIGVDYLDERQFARTAVARARAGAEVVNLTWRSRYSEQPAARTLGYTDSNTSRAWGVTEWSRRAGQAAIFDWILGNALLPEADTTREGIERIDRTTVTELGTISSHLGSIQLTLDNSDAGLNPLGLDPDVVPFDIDPTHIDVGSTAQIGRQAVQGLSHFEQIFERAYEALRNASGALDNANIQKAQLRQVAQSADDFRVRAAAEDIEYRNRLIEIFGTPYTGQIGAGKAYPAGYQGPDYNLFMYVDVNDVNADTVPVANSDTYFDEYVSFYDLLNDVPDEFKTDLEEHFLDDITLEGNTAVGLLGDDLVHLRLPALASDYAFVAPANWGQRDAPGRLQALVGEMVQVQSDLGIAVGDYDFLIKQLRDRVALLKMRADISSDVLSIKSTLYDDIESLNERIDALRTTAAVLNTSADVFNDVVAGIIEGLPKVVGLANDATFAARNAIKIAGSVAYGITRGSATFMDSSADILENSKELVSLQAEREIDGKEMSVELRGMLYDIEELLVNEGVTRMKLFTMREQLRGLFDQYRATLQEGVRLIEERRQANAIIAAETQENRYHDVLFRTARYEAIQRYRVLYDLAQRYCYLATKAYDYETNFDPRDRASGRPFLNEIVRARTLGELGDDFPLSGAGLAGTMARLHETFRSIEGRLGFNNFQYDQTSFSIRNEQARLKPSEDGATDQDWVDKLESARVDDLWDIPEFRKFCRPFAPRGTPQPGIVLRFRSAVRAGENFFGNPLGGGDASYDPTLYATKIRAAGIRIDGYPLEDLARTPGVYLIPAGLDYMSIPNSPTLALRAWNVVDQAIPSPYQLGATELGRPDWIAGIDSLSGQAGEARRFSSFRASVSEDPSEDNAFNSTRLIGRSVWNDQWILIIPGQSLHADPAEGLDRFVQSVTDIRLNFETYGYSGN